MKKSALILTAVPTVLGIAGGVLHSIEINTTLDVSSGLADRLAPISICMTAVAILTMVMFFALINLVKGRDVEPVYHKAFSPHSLAPLILSVPMGAAMIFGAYLCFRDGVSIRSPERLVMVLVIFAALSGISHIVMSLMAYLKKSGAETMLCSFVIVLFFCLWLIVYYQAKAADTAMISYVYDYLAICAAAISGYYSAGYAFGRSRPRATLFFAMTAAFFSLTALPKAMTPAFCIFFAALALQQLLTVFLLANNLRYRRAEKKEEPEELPENEE